MESVGWPTLGPPACAHMPGGAIELAFGRCAWNCVQLVQGLGTAAVQSTDKGFQNQVRAFDTPFSSDVSSQSVEREKARARALRKSQWWRRQIDKGTCHYCGERFAPDELTMDHIVPLIRGGLSTRGNVVPACKVCNNKKKYLLPLEWDEYLANLQSGTRRTVQNGVNP